MQVIIPIVLPILLLIMAFWFIKINYRSYVINWKNELTIKKVLNYGIIAFLKSSILFILIIVIHNYFHSDHLLELILFIGLYIVFAIIQSSYSIGGFLSRMKYIGKYSLSTFRKKSKEADNLLEKIIDEPFLKYSVLIKIIIIISFLFIFTPNITIFVISNIYYFLIIISLILLSLVLNNIIYFGLISLIIFQFHPVNISFFDVNYIVLILSYLVLLVGIIFETRMDNRMFKIIASRTVKDLNFKIEYTQVYNRKDIVVYQNNLNKYYYVYFRLNGIVTVFESMFDAKLSDFLVRKMVFKGTQYLKEFGEI